jgi:phenylalanine-4-hydroxylase
MKGQNHRPAGYGSACDQPKPRPFDGLFRYRPFAGPLSDTGTALTQIYKPITDNQMDSFNDFGNLQVTALPGHLKQYIVDQHYDRYTPADHAVWRYVMRQNHHYLKDAAYYPYIPGLKAAGLSIEKIPSLQEMNDALGKIGWGAVTVNGFIPPSAFMEFQACRVLVIAADIRQIKHIGYTPAPDIIHEAAGHAPIIADPDYQQYLSYFGSIGAKAISSAADLRLYSAIRELSILKETANAAPEEIERAEEAVKYCQQHPGRTSEMSLLSRLHWWTVEYGLIGSLTDPRIYGAGLLSSVGESADCMRPEVTKLPYTIDAVNYPYDITRPQPQLFVTPTFQNLTDVLEQFADTMAFRRGGYYGIKKAIESESVCTAVFNTGLQVSGLFTTAQTSAGGDPAFIRTMGPATLSYKDHLIPGQGAQRHVNGFSSPVGKLKDTSVPLEFRLLFEGELLVLHYESGILLTGVIEHIYKFDGRNVLVTLSQCTIIDRLGSLLFEPEWGAYDLAVGESIVSVHGGPADKEAFPAEQPMTAVPMPESQPEQLSPALRRCYAAIRKARESKFVNHEQLVDLWSLLRRDHPEDWLCTLELLEVLETRRIMPQLALELCRSLVRKAEQNKDWKQLILKGLQLLATECAPDMEKKIAEIFQA